MDTDRNLLFGVLALQTDLIDQKQFSEACAAWATRKNVPLADVLIELGWITTEDRSDVEKLLARKLKRHGGNAHATLGTVMEPSVRDMLTMSPDDDVRQSMAGFASSPNYALETLLAPVEGGPRYSRTRLHGQGGLGRVWVAHDSDLNREVALKELRPEWTKRPEAWKRFLKEAQITGQLDHPNIVPVYELSQRLDGGQPFYTMKLVRGRTLQDAIKEHHEARAAGRADVLGLGRLLSAFVSVCNALGYAHSRGVVHRDLKPENVVLGAFGEVIVLDWGLAKVASDKVEPTEDTAVISISDDAMTDATLAGRQLGTPSYMSPEQADGRIDLIDERTDVFGLGAILFSILSGRPPFAGKSTMLMLPEIAQGPMPLVRDVVPDVPKALAAICAKAMQKSRAERYQSALELAADVSRFLADEPVTAYPEPATTRAMRWMRRHRTWTQAAALLLVVITVVSIAAVMMVNRSHRAERYSRVLAEQAQKSAEMSRDKSESERERAEAFSEESRQRLVQLQQGHGQRLLDQDKPAASLVWFAEALRLDGPQSDTAELQRVRLGTVMGHVPRPLQFYPHQSAVNSAEFSGDGMRVVTASDDRTACVWDTRSGQRVGAPMSHDERVRGAHFSPDGKQVVTFSLDWTARVWDAATGSPLTPPLKHHAAVWSAEFSADGRRVVTASADQTARVWDAATGESVAGPFEHASDVWHAVLSPDGQRVATGSSDQTARVWNLEDGSSLPPVSHAGWVRFVQFSSDGHRLATCGNDSQALVWTLADGKLVLKATLKHPNSVLRAAFSGDGHRLVTVCDGQRFIWDVEAPKHLGLPQRFSTWRFNPAYSADGQWVLSRPEGHQVAILSNLTSLNGSLPHWELMSAVRAARFSADGRRVVIGTSDGQVRVCDSVTGEPISSPIKHQGVVQSVAFRADGQWIVTASRDKTARVWDAVTGEPVGPPLTHAEAILQAWFNPAGDAVVTVSEDETAVLWDMPSGTKRHTWTHQAPVLTAQFSASGDLVVTASRDQTAQVWDTKTGRPVGAPLRHGGWVNGAWFSPTGDRVLTVSADRTAQLWMAKSGEAVRSAMTHEGEVFCGAFSPDGQWVATGGYDASVRIWNTETGALAVAPIKHTGLVESVAFSADSRWLVSASADQSARIWDVATGMPLSPPFRHRDSVRSAEFRHDGQQVLTASSDQSARLWSIARESRPPEQLRPLAELLAGMRGNEAGDLEPLPRDRLLELWSEQSQRFPEEFAPNPELAVNWRRREALRAELLGLWEETHRHLHDLIQAGHDQPAWRTRRADAAMHLGLWDSAIADYDRGLEQSATDARLWLQRGRAHWASGHSEQAHQDFRQASDRRPKDAALWLLRSLTTAETTGTAADDDFRQALEWSALMIPRLDRRWKDRLLELAPAGPHWNDLDDDLTRRLQTSADDSRIWRARGLVRALLRRWSESAGDFQKAAELTNSDVESWRGLARVHAELNQPDKGLAAVTAAIALRADDWSLWFLRGCLQFQAQTYDKAAADFTRAQELGASGFGLSYERGRAHALTSKRELAIADFTAALRLRPKDAETLTFRGMSHAATGAHGLAIDDFNAALELNPQSALTLYNRAESFRLQKDFDRAIADCTEAIRLDPKAELAYVNRADAYADRGDDARAMADYTEAIQINPRSTYAHTKRAAALARQGETLKAIADYDTALRLNPRSLIYLQRGLLRQQLGEHTKAVADFNSLLALAPTNAAAFLARGQSQAALGEWSLAVKDLQDASRLGANDAEVWRPVEQHCAQLVEKEPDNVAAWYQLGVARAGLRNWPAAEEALSRALNGKLDVTASADALYHRARVRVELDRRPAAIADLTASLRGRPKFAPALLLRSGLLMDTGEWFSSVADLVTASNAGEKRTEVFGKAIERLNERIQQEDANWKWWAGRGICQYQLAKYELALSDFEKAQERGATGSEFAFVKGFAHSRTQQWEAAIGAYDEYIKTNTKTAVVYSDRGKAHLQLAHWTSGTRDLDQAIKLGESSDVLWASVLTQFEQRVKSNADDANAHLGVALAHRRLKHWAETIEHSQRVLSLAADSRLAVALRGVAHAELGHWNEARADLLSGAEKSPDDVTSWEAVAHIALETRDDELYQKACSRLLDLAQKPESKLHRNTIAWTSVFRPLSEDEAGRTLKIAREVVVANPQSYSEVNTLGAALYRAGEWDECIQVLEKAITLHGKGARAMTGSSWRWLNINGRTRSKPSNGCRKCGRFLRLRAKSNSETFKARTSVPRPGPAALAGRRCGGNSMRSSIPHRSSVTSLAGCLPTILAGRLRGTTIRPLVQSLTGEREL